LKASGRRCRAAPNGEAGQEKTPPAVCAALMSRILIADRGTRRGTASFALCGRTRRRGSGTGKSPNRFAEAIPALQRAGIGVSLSSGKLRFPFTALRIKMFFFNPCQHGSIGLKL